MAFSYACLTVQRLVIPAVLVLAALFRPVGISFVYLLMFFISPFIPVATNQNFKGSVTAYFLILIALSTILLLCHIALQVTIIALGIGDLFGTCSFTERLLRHIGFIDFKNLRPLAIIEWLAPEVVVFVTSIAVYFVTKKLSFQSVPGQVENMDAAVAEDGNVPATTSTASATVARTAAFVTKRGNVKPNFDALIKISPLFCLATLFFAAVLRPSVPGGFYFLIFLLSGSYWATFQSLQRGFAVLMRFVMVVLVLHIISIVSYQTPWAQKLSNANSTKLAERLIGLEPLVTSSCAKDIRIIFYDTMFNLDSYLSPIAILFSYYALALTSKNLIKKRVSIRRDHRSTEPTETTPLVRHNTRRKVDRTANNEAITAIGGAAGVTASNDIPLDALDSRLNEDDSGSSLFDQICYGIVSVGGFIYQNSYIFTNILMMTWSIVYHSWLTFALLLWANVLWMIPNQRKAMMRSSPFIVLYAELLCVAQYIYGMDLTNDELPDKVNATGINLAQIGLERPQSNGVQPCIPLIVKTSFLLMFWVTLRQFFKEKSEKHPSSVVADMMTQLQISTASEYSSRHENKKTSKFLKKAGDIIKNLLVRLWIWLLIFVIFLCAITGDKMTGFRICYMALFLFFLLVFQSSSKAWVKIMYGFWLFLIFYAMSILILIYTYQFDKFDEYWHDYLNISKTLQTDIGLEQYKTKDLFLHLVSPTIIVILTVIQVHYFHRRFIASLQQPMPTAAAVDQQQVLALTAGPMEQQSVESNAAQPTDAANASTPATEDRISLRFKELNIDAPPPDESTLEASIKDLFRRCIKEFKSRAKDIAKNFKGVFWSFLELHLIKAVYITAFVCCVREVCVLHIVFVGLCILGLISKASVQIFLSRIISLIVSIIILTKMVYQIGYLDHSRYDVTCGLPNETPQNNAVWFGLQKADKEGGLMDLIKKYIIYMVVATIHAVVTLRQTQMRTVQGVADVRPKVLFPNVVRADAEKNLKGMIKYLFNYGFYKFGLETTLIALVALITYRQDIVAIFYAMWLCVLLLCDRAKCAKFWSVFQCFTATIIFVQYILFVGLPPGLCLDYPWRYSPYSEALQRWAMLPGNLNYSHVKKLIFDFILLLFINRQKRVFNAESRNETDNNYPGGTNKSVIEDIANLGTVPFENPTKDFLSTIRNYLDIFKNAILCGFYWTTLAVVFLAGTNITDLLAIGYLVGSFTFLWQGSDFYLRPIDVILNRWNLLILYNVFNILIKTCLQIAGCMFLVPLRRHTCWLVHILGISCANGGVPTPDAALDGECPNVGAENVLVWDAACFAFLIFQLRIFKSHYFCHIINDTKANTILASRGAEIIEDLRQKQIEHRKGHEQEVLHKIKRKMEKIRATQQKMLRPIDKPTHFDAIRAGDYYMFEDMDEKFELDLIEDEVDFLEDQGKISDSEKKMNRRKTLYEIEKDPKVEKPKVERPSTSRDIQTEEHSESKKKTETDSTDATEKESEDIPSTNPIIRLLEAFLVTLAVRLNRFSRNYRYVNKILAEEKKALKESKGFDRYGRYAAANLWTPFVYIRRQLMSDIDDAASSSSSSRNIALNNIKSDTNTHKTDINATTTTTTTTTTATTTEPSSQSQEQHVAIIDMPQFDTVDGRYRKDPGSQGSLSKAQGAGDFTFEEDFAARDHHIVVEVLISAWYAVLSNTDLICYIVVFINQVFNASIISLPLPIMVFLWGTLSVPRPTKTFWVTLIAYTQAIVLIKCIFTFKLLWVNYNDAAVTHQPLSAAKIIGIEANQHNANFDLLLLLVLFFHRFVLKSQGLWKSEYKEEFIQATNYGLRDDAPESDGVSMQRSIEENNSNSKSPREQGGDDQLNLNSTNSLETSGEYLERGISKLTSTKYLSSTRGFFFNLMHKARLPTDVYALMFLCDFVNFFVLLFGFTAFGPQQDEGDGGVQTYLSENKVPKSFLIMLLVQFILIVIDRSLYLRKSLRIKIWFHFLSVIGIHIWMFFVIPAVTERSFYSLAPPIIFYVIKCFCLLLSSFQIKCGFPKRILGNFLTKGFSMANMIAFKVYMLIPFLYELRTILDWVCTDTTMTLFDWLKMEDIFSEIYFIKCSRQMEQDFPAMRAQKKAMLVKILLGGTFILLIVVCIWGPLCLFALGNAVGQANVPYEVSASLRIGPYDPIYATNSRESIYEFNSTMFSDLQGAFLANRSRHAMTFMTSYYPEDIAAVVLPGNSSSLWAISPPDKDRLLQDLMSNKSLTCRFTYSLSRTPPTKGSSATVSSEITYELDSTFAGRDTMIAMLQGVRNDEVIIPALLPKFIKVLNSGDLNIVTALMPENELYRPLAIRLHTLEDPLKGIWWEIRESCNDTFYEKILSVLPFSNCDSDIVMYTFNDKKFPSTFSVLTAGGIIGLYTTFVLLASRFLKSFISGQSRKIMFEDLPYVDRVLQLCLDIYLVREALEFALEEDLFAKLLFLYRSPETMIKWTRPKEDTNEDETDTESVRSRNSSRRPELPPS